MVFGTKIEAELRTLLLGRNVRLVGLDMNKWARIGAVYATMTHSLVQRPGEFIRLAYVLSRIGQAVQASTSGVENPDLTKGFHVNAKASMTFLTTRDLDNPDGNITYSRLHLDYLRRYATVSTTSGKYHTSLFNGSFMASKPSDSFNSWLETAQNVSISLHLKLQAYLSPTAGDRTVKAPTRKG